MPRYALQGFFSFAFVGNMASAYGVSARTRWARPASLAVNYLVTLIAASATLHLFNAYRAIGDLGEGLYKAFIPSSSSASGCCGSWSPASCSPTARPPSGPNNLRKAGWGLAALAGVWFVIKADPSGMISSFGDSVHADRSHSERWRSRSALRSPPD